MEYIPAKSIIIKSKSTGWFGADYNMNIYKGCCHGCIYCDSRSDCYRVEDFDRVRAKENALQIIRDELKRKVRSGVIATGAMSDPYNPFEEELKLTRNALELINAFEFGLAIATKSPLITRDIDILKDIKSHSPVIVKMTITTADDALCKKIEPNVAPTSERWKALNTLSENGIYCGILLMPILPFINDTKENVLEIVKQAKENGASFIYPAMGVTLRDNQRVHYYNKLVELFPGIKEKYIKQYGTRYSCGSPKAKELYSVLSNECSKHEIQHKMGGIIRRYKAGYENPQISMF